MYDGENVIGIMLGVFNGSYFFFKDGIYFLLNCIFVIFKLDKNGFYIGIKVLYFGFNFLGKFCLFLWFWFWRCVVIVSIFRNVIFDFGDIVCLKFFVIFSII